MRKETYMKMTQPFRDHPGLAKGIHIVNKLCTFLMYMAYPLFLAYLLYRNDSEPFVLAKVVLVPGVSFVALSLSRKLINRPRPYEKFGVAPIIKKETKGNSFPSRHVFSAAIIAMTFLMMSPWSWLGALFLVATFLLAIVRVVSGVHFISDVIAGFLVAVLCAMIGYYIF